MLVMYASNSEFEIVYLKLKLHIELYLTDNAEFMPSN